MFFISERNNGWKNLDDYYLNMVNIIWLIEENKININ